MSDTSHHVLTGKLDITSNLLVGSSHLFVDTNNNRVGLVTTDPHAGLHVNSNAYVNTDLRVGPTGPNQVVINATAGRIKAASFEGDGSLLQNTPPGAAATIAVGTTTTGAAGSSASVTNSGTSSAAVFNFTIPKGDKGDTGDPGNPGAPGADGTNYFVLSGSNIYRSTGNVGIGNTNPSVAKLHIGPLNGDHLYLASGNNAYGWKLDTDDQSNGAVPFRIKKRTADVDTTVLTIKNQDGFVGIGASVPACALDIAGEDVMIRGNTPSLHFSEGTNGMDGAFRIHYDGANQVDDNNFLAIQHGTNFADTSLHCTRTGNVGVGTSSPGHVLDIQGSQAFDASTTLRVLNPASQYGRTQLHLVGRYEANNDGWSAGGARNAIMFKSQSSQNSAITNQWTIQSFPNGTSNELGFMSGSNDAPRFIIRGNGSTEFFPDAQNPLKVTSRGTATNTHNFVLNGPRPGTSSGGATHFINGSTRSQDGGHNTYTIRNDSGQLRLGNSSYTTLMQGNHLRMAEGDNSFFHFGPNSSWSGELFVGATTNRSTAATKAQVISTDGNLHLDSGTSKGLYLNHHTGNIMTPIYRKGPQYWNGRPMVMVGKSNGRVYSGNYVIFNVVGYNDGNMYNSSNGRFTAPWTGYYLFTATLLGGEQDEYTNTRWYINGGVVNWGAAHFNLGSGVHFNTSNARMGLSTQMIYYMYAGNYMQLYMLSHSIYGASSLHSTTTCVYLGGKY